LRFLAEHRVEELLVALRSPDPMGQWTNVMEALEHWLTGGSSAEPETARLLLPVVRDEEPGEKSPDATQVAAPVAEDYQWVDVGRLPLRTGPAPGQMRSSEALPLLFVGSSSVLERRRGNALVEHLPGVLSDRQTLKLLCAAPECRIYDAFEGSIPADVSGHSLISGRATKQVAMREIFLWMGDVLGGEEASSTTRGTGLALAGCSRIPTSRETGCFRRSPGRGRSTSPVGSW